MESELKNAICETYLLLAEEPQAKLTVANIVKKSGVSRSSFYYYFEDIDHVFRYMAQTFCENYVCHFFNLLSAKEYND